MSVLNSNAKECDEARQWLDAYLDNELPEQALAGVRQHVESCPGCGEELAARVRVRDAVRRAAARQIAPESLRLDIQRQLRLLRPDVVAISPRFRLVLGAIAVACIVLVIMAAEQWVQTIHGQRLVNSILALGVSDHVQCALKGHNYPEAANPPEVLHQKLGPSYAGLLEIVQRNLPDFEILEAHICSLPGSPRKYVHFIARGRGTILSVVLTRSGGELLPREKTRAKGKGAALYEAHLGGMSVAGFAAHEYWGFVVSDLGQDSVTHLAEGLAPPVIAALEAGSPQPRADSGDVYQARLDLAGH